MHAYKLSCVKMALNTERLWMVRLCCLAIGDRVDSVIIAWLVVGESTVYRRQTVLSSSLVIISHFLGLPKVYFRSSQEF